MLKNAILTIWPKVPSSKTRAISQRASPVSFTLLGTKGLMVSFIQGYLGVDENPFLKRAIPGLKQGV
jgi:hypothetical protein